MAHPRCLAHCSPARALHRIFISDLPTATPCLGRQTASYHLPLAPRPFSSSSSSSSYSHLRTGRRQIIRSSPAVPAQTRALSTTPALRRILTFKQRPTNEDIPYGWVRIAGDDGLSAPQPKSAVLATLNPKTHTLVMVAPPPELSESSEEESETSFSEEQPMLDGPPAAICRIFDNEAAAAAEAEAALAQRRKAVDTKELELSWGIAQHDLEHKLRRMREFLSKGLAVEIVLAKKRRGRPATREQAEAVLAAIRDAVSVVEGARESRKMDGAVGGVAKIFLEGPVGKRKRKKKQVEEEEPPAEEAAQVEGSV